MAFFRMPPSQRRRQIERIMQESAASFNHANTARQYIDLYEKMLERPLIS
jgi:starch synthase